MSTFKQLRPLIVGLFLAASAVVLCSQPAQAEIVLRQATASQAVVIGPFVDSTDGNTAETGLTISNTDVRISINGGNITGKNSGGCTHDEIGYYTCTFDATDTATVGRMQVMVHESGALPVYHEFQIVEEAVYDACCAADAAPATPATIAAELGTGTQFTAIPWNSAWDVEVQSEAADALNAENGANFSSIPWNSAWDAEVQSEATDALNAYDPPTNTEMTSAFGALNDLSSAEAQSAAAAALTAYDPPTNAELTARTLASASYATATALATVDSNVDAILVDTGTTLDGKLNTIDSVVDAIKAKTDSLTFTVTGEVDANLQSINDNALTGNGTTQPFDIAE